METASAISQNIPDRTAKPIALRAYRVGTASAATLGSLADALEQTPGVCLVDLDVPGATVEVEFDTRRVGEADIAALVSRLGAPADTP